MKWGLKGHIHTGREWCVRCACFGIEHIKINETLQTSHCVRRSRPVLGCVSLTATDCPTGRRTILPCYLSIAEWSDARSDSPSLLVKHTPVDFNVFYSKIFHARCEWPFRHWIIVRLVERRVSQASQLTSKLVWPWIYRHSLTLTWPSGAWLNAWLFNRLINQLPSIIS